MTDYTYMPEGSLIGSESNDYFTSDLRHLERAMHSGIIIEGIVTSCAPETLDLTVSVGAFRGIIMREEAAYCPDGNEVKDIAVITRVGKAAAFKITDIVKDEHGEVLLLLSRKAAQEECTKNYIKSLRAGDIIPALVTHLEPFGAFVDIGCGIISLLTVDAISVSRISHPRDRFRCGEQIMAVVRSIDRDTGRIYMSCRELLGTWEENAAEFSPSQTVSGVVRSIESYGIFVELAPNLAGLAEYREDVEVGDVCAVYIKSIIPERMKIKLVMIDSVKGSYEPRMKYFVDFSKVRHMDSWRYSPEGATKLVESVF
ncbi:MAG: S1 RNA-binding domain-containing protein [Clostridia bacterium]|nr:S1 RNA-binding domain-containing protein [Clostridia bacterium]